MLPFECFICEGLVSIIIEEQPDCVISECVRCGTQSILYVKVDSPSNGGLTDRPGVSLQN